MRIAMAVAGILALAGCEGTTLAGLGQQVQSDLETLDLVTDTRRAFAAEFQDQPFALGVISVVAEEHGELHTYSLTPCQGNTRICGPGGRAGTLTRYPDYVIVTGAYPGRSFYLSPGGDGWLLWRGAWHPLAWQ